MSELQKLQKLAPLSLLPGKKCRHPRKYFSTLIPIDLLSVGKSVPSTAQVVFLAVFINRCFEIQEEELLANSESSDASVKNGKKRVSCRGCRRSGGFEPEGWGSQEFGGLLEKFVLHLLGQHGWLCRSGAKAYLGLSDLESHRGDFLPGSCLLGLTQQTELGPSGLLPYLAEPKGRCPQPPRAGVAKGKKNNRFYCISISFQC